MGGPGRSTLVTAISMGNSVPSARRARSSVRLPMIRDTPVARYRASPPWCLSRSDSGIRVSAMGFPITSSRACPNIASAAGLNSVISPFASIATTASIADCRMAPLRASLARRASSACLRSTNWPIWLPMAPTMASRSGSGWRISGLKNSRTPSTFPRATTGNATALWNPAWAAAGARGKLSSSPISGIHAGCPVCHTLPGSPMPGGNSVSRHSSSKCARSAPGPCHSVTRRRTLAFSSIIHIPPKSQSSASHAAWRISGAASARPSARDRALVTAYWAVRRRSCRRRSEMSTETPVEPMGFPFGSRSGASETNAVRVEPSLWRMGNSPSHRSPPVRVSRASCASAWSPGETIRSRMLRPFASSLDQP